MPPKVALCFIISYKHELHQEEYWKKWISCNSDIINVYVHYKNYKFIKSDWLKKHCIPENWIQQTTYYNVVPAYLTTMWFAHEHDKDNQWFCMLTDSCAPIVNSNVFRDMFKKNYNKSLLKHGLAYWNVDFHKRANLRLLPREWRLSNDPWFVLCRRHVRLCMLFSKMQHSIYQTMLNGGLANESVFAVALCYFKELNGPNVINKSSTISDWSRMSSATSPYLFKKDTPENRKMIKSLLDANSHAMFIRKVSSDFPVENLVCLDVDEKKPESRNIHIFIRNSGIIFVLLAMLLAFFIHICNHK